ncbi:parvulin-like peptidyl-prolyl isomerase [Streptococcus pneumoniae]|nr:parvulin-like peptidyl-prolyl isomerase [Streptococcus pneumoniae]
MTQKQNDSTFVQSIIGKELQAANIKVKDQAFQNIFTQYIGGGDSSSSSSTSILDDFSVFLVSFTM